MISEVESRDDLRRLFPLIDTGMAEISRRNGETRWIGADVYSLALDGTIKVAVIHGEDPPTVYGWVSWHIDDDGLTRKELSVFMMYLVPDAPRRLMAEVTAFLDTAAIEQGARTIRFDTVREAWARRLAPFGYTKQAIVLTREVTA